MAYVPGTLGREARICQDVITVAVGAMDRPAVLFRSYMHMGRFNHLEWRPFAMKNLVLTSALMALLLGPAVSAETGDDVKSDEGYRCAWARHIDNFKLVDDKTAILTQGVSKKYKVTFLNPCRDLRFEETIAIDTTSSCIEKGDALIVSGAGGIKTRCVIVDIARLPKEDKDGDEADDDAKE
jgi:hypothetical protein